LAFGREGADVAVNYHASAGPAADVVQALEKLGRRTIALRADVAREHDVRVMIDAALQRFGRIDILVNNAGIMTRGPFHETTIQSYDEMFAINVTGTMPCTHYALPGMIARRDGRIINLSSQLAQRGVGSIGSAAYTATKGAIESFTRALAEEVGQ